MQFLKLSHEIIKDKNITSNEFRIYTYLLSLYNEEKQCSFPSIETMSRDTNISIATVKKSIKRLAELEYIVIEKRRGISGNYNIYKKLKHLIGSVLKKDNKKKIKIDSNGNEPIEGQIEVEEIINCTDEFNKEEIEEKRINKIDNHTNVRLARSVTNIDNSKFAKKILSLADESLVREAIRDFKSKKGKTPTFLIKLVVDQYYKASINLSKPLLNLLKKAYIII
ncbi:MAG: helix-turn-helix domain-containing protein [Clostridium sp.]|nr:helix-turn-helix domain-containing protein [Clostridium sp.]